MLVFMKNVVVTMLIGFSILSAHAVTPQPGLWNVDSEVNGLPGRGIQIDAQDGGSIVASYYGYRADGSATFYLAAGTLTDGHLFSSNLIEYKNGPVLGGSEQIGEVGMNIGKISIDFDSSASAIIYLPGEEPKRISPLVYEDHKLRLNNYFAATSANHVRNADMPLIPIKGLDIAINDVVDPNPRTRVRIAIIPQIGSGACSFDGTLQKSGKGFSAVLSGACTTNIFGPTYIKDIRVDSAGILSMDVTAEYLNERNPLIGRFFGICVDRTDQTTPCSPSQLKNAE